MPFSRIGMKSVRSIFCIFLKLNELLYCSPVPYWENVHDRELNFFLNYVFFSRENGAKGTIQFQIALYAL